MNKWILPGASFFIAGLLMGCVHSPLQTVPTHSSFKQESMLESVHRHMLYTQQQAEAGQREAAMDYGRWLVSAGETQAAIPLLEQAAQHQNSDAYYLLGLALLDVQPAQSRVWFERAAELGHVEAAKALAKSHSAHPLLPDDQQGFNWLLQAAQHGDAQAQNDVGAAYSRGIGVAKDTGLAVQWYRKAAEQGNALGQFNLAGAYQAGEGVKSQPDAAYAWYALAAQQTQNAQLAKISEQMKLRMYAEAARIGKAAQARQLAENYRQNGFQPGEGIAK